METNNNFYNNLNRSQNLEDVYKLFSTYREEVTNIIIDLLRVRKKDDINILVFGAGNLMDIDYKQLKSFPNCHQIILTDIDDLAMHRGMEFLGLSQSEFRTSSFNYIGEFVEEAMHVLVDQLNSPNISKKESIDRVEMFFEEVIEEFKRDSYLDHIFIKGDIVVVMPIYTQLLYIEIDTKLKSTKGYPYIKGLILQKMIYVINEFNKKVLNCVSKDGNLIVLSDILEEKINRESINETSVEIKEKIQTYEKTYGVGLGSFGLLNICDYARPLSEYYINWKFSEDRKFLVKGLLLERLNNQ